MFLDKRTAFKIEAKFVGTWERDTGTDLADVLQKEGELDEDELIASYEREKFYQKVGANHALDMANRVVDSQINKAAGILCFGSLLLAAIRGAEGKLSPLLPAYWTALNTVLAMLACVLLLRLFCLRWGSISTYRTVAQEYASTITLVRQRTILMESAQLALGLAITIYLFGTLPWVAMMATAK